MHIMLQILQQVMQAPQTLREYVIALVKHGHALWNRTKKQRLDYAREIFKAFYRHFKYLLESTIGDRVTVKLLNVLKTCFNNVQGYAIHAKRMLTMLEVLAGINPVEVRYHSGRLILVYAREDLQKLVKLMEEIAKEAGVELE